MRFEVYFDTLPQAGGSDAVAAGEGWIAFVSCG